ncbi:MAG: hypothetical protein IKK93_07665 [Campylobacter sp.]|nr:hypothetical protein [Campylobacter sp.]
MTNKIIRLCAFEYPLPIFGILGLIVLVIGLAMLASILNMAEITVSFAVLTLAMCISGVIFILAGIILFALSELRKNILKEKWYNS